MPTLEDACTLLRVLARSATGQEFAAYTTVLTGPKRPADLDGPTAFHVVLVDNGRSAMIGSEFQDILRCIRCGACMNHCPVYLTAGGHAYGWVYPGPMGAVLTPSFIGIEQAHHLPSASTFCGRCEQVCPVRIPLPKMMRHWREQQFTKGLSPPVGALRHPAVGVRRQAAGAVPRRRAPRGRRCSACSAAAPAAFAALPLAGGWTGSRDFPAPQGATFQALWRAARKRSVSEDARAAVLGRLRRALGRGRDADELRRAMRQRLSEPARQPDPGARRSRPATAGSGCSPPRPRRSRRRCAGSIATAICRDAVIDYLRLHNLPPRLVMASDPLLAQADWRSTMLEIRHGRAVDQDPVGLTTAFAGIAETGTLMLLSAPETPTTLAFLPETSLVALSAERIAARLRGRLAPAARGAGRAAALDQLHHRAVALGRHRADPAARRARAAPAVRAAGRRAAGRSGGGAVSRPRRPTAEELALWRRAMGVSAPQPRAYAARPAGRAAARPPPGWNAGPQ